MIKITINKYEYSCNLLNLFDHADFAQRYSLILASSVMSEDAKRKIKQAHECTDETLKEKLNEEITAFCIANLTKEKIKELNDMKMIALVDGQCTARKLSDPITHQKPIYEKEVFAKHFRENATPKDMIKLLDFLLTENVKDFF